MGLLRDWLTIDLFGVYIFSLFIEGITTSERLPADLFLVASSVVHKIWRSILLSRNARRRRHLHNRRLMLLFVAGDDLILRLAVAGARPRLPINF